MPLKVAVAGATSGLSHSIISALLDTPNLDILLLTHSSPSQDLSHFTSLGTALHRVDYSSIPSLISSLKDVHTVLCTISSWPQDPTPVYNLIKASQQAGVKRFAPAEFSFSMKACEKLVLIDAKERVREMVRKSGMECTIFENGIFMDYFAFGAPRKYEEVEGFKLIPFVLDVPSRKALIPGTGQEKDLGHFVAAAVKLKGRWPKELGMVGETTTFNQVVKDVETVTGRKIDVEYLDKERIARLLEESKGDVMKFFYTQCLEVIAANLGSVQSTLNRLTPHKPTSVKEFLVEYWLA